MENNSYTLLLADDDIDDCLFFKDALEELPISSTLTIVDDGVELMELLNKKTSMLPHAIFLDLNMPRKTGVECLLEIKKNQKLNQLPIIILSTSFDHAVVNSLYDRGATFYIQKPGEFSKLKKVIHEAITFTFQKDFTRREKEKFVIQG